MNVGLEPNEVNLVCIVHAFYMFDDFSIRFHIIYFTSLALVFAMANSHYLCVGKFTLQVLVDILLLPLSG